MKTEYDLQAEKFLEKTETELLVEFIKHDKYFPDDKQTRDIYNVTLKRKRGSYTFTFGQSIANTRVSLEAFARSSYRDQIKVYRKHFPQGKHDSVKAMYTALKNKKFEPSAYDVLACLDGYSPGTFEDFCDCYGYDTDSIKAKKTYDAVVDQYFNLERLFTPEELELLNEIR